MFIFYQTQNASLALYVVVLISIPWFQTFASRHL